MPEESPGTSVSVNPKQVYLDQELVISGSGFLRYETATVHIDLGDGLEPRLGSVDSNRCGDWSLRLRPLGGGPGVTENIGEILDRGVVTLRALGAGGSQASVPLSVLGARGPVSKLGSLGPPFYRPPDGVPEFGIWVQPTSIYLDQELVIRGSGFEKNNPVVVYLYRRDVVDIELGSVDSDQDGAWTLTFSALDGESGVASHSNEILPPGWRSFLNVTAEAEAGNATSTPLQILGAETPDVELCPVPILLAGAMWINGRIELLGTGFKPNERVTLLAYLHWLDIRRYVPHMPGVGDGNRRAIVQGQADDSGILVLPLDLACQDPDDDDGDYKCLLRPGSHTLEVFGQEGSYAAAPLVVSGELGPK